MSFLSPDTIGKNFFLPTSSGLEKALQWNTVIYTFTKKEPTDVPAQNLVKIQLFEEKEKLTSAFDLWIGWSQ